MSKQFWKTLALSLLVVLLTGVGLVSHLVMPKPAIAQVTSVSQLPDVQPTDWYFQALQSMVERYGVVGVYPDGTFRANRPGTRGEIAGLINASLDRVLELIAATTADMTSREDFAAMQHLVEELSQEVRTLKAAQKAEVGCPSSGVVEAGQK